jgi:glutamyl-tRNA reductase
MTHLSPAMARTACLRAITFHHRIAPLEVLERVALSPAAAQQLCRELLSRGVEAVALSTCHRTELYWDSAGTRHDALAEAALRARVTGAWPGDEWRMQRLEDEAVRRHLLRVAAGLESVLVGETEVIGQVRVASEIAHAAGMRSPVLVELLRDALRFGRLARSRTRIGTGALSVAAAAVKLLRETHHDLHHCTVLVVGAGRVGLRVVRHLLAERVGRCILLNRTLAHAETATAALSDRVTAAPLSELPAWLADASAVVAAAQAESLIVTAEVVRVAREGRMTPLVIMDVSMPRVVDPAVADIAGVRLRDLCGLQALVEENRARREAEIPRVEALLDEMLGSYRRRAERRLAWNQGIAPRGRTG